MGWVLWVAVLAINVGAIFALVALRRADRARLARWKRLCFASAASVFGLCVGLFLLGAILTNPDSSSGAERSRFLANVISEGINSFVFAMVTSLLPLIATFVLRRRERRAGADAVV